MHCSIRLVAVTLFCAVTAPAAAQELSRSASPLLDGPTVAAPAHALVLAPAPSATASLAPTVGHAAVGVRSPAVAADAGAVPKRAQTSRNVALMIVGAAGLIVGAIIGDTAGTIIMVGGGITGLIGLYQYLQ